MMKRLTIASKIKITIVVGAIIVKRVITETWGAIGYLYADDHARITYRIKISRGGDGKKISVKFVEPTKAWTEGFTSPEENQLL